MTDNIFQVSWDWQRLWWMLQRKRSKRCVAERLWWLPITAETTNISYNVFLMFELATCIADK